MVRGKIANLTGDRTESQGTQVLLLGPSVTLNKSLNPPGVQPHHFQHEEGLRSLPALTLGDTMIPIPGFSLTMFDALLTHCQNTSHIFRKP